MGIIEIKRMQSVQLAFLGEEIFVLKILLSARMLKASLLMFIGYRSVLFVL